MLWYDKEGLKTIWTRRATLRKFNLNPIKENLNYLKTSATKLNQQSRNKKEPHGKTANQK